ncbi:hypothetical protein TNCT_250891 [Trichonephila clavata]|uniref:Uncharacterized protein n=1 Tax=Trichonephila clavata TaxID=2740835 RepID=A0A8X6M4C2_TRICU|nr:hypothetical protein TNCT_250891 [Trichonephila clavata]
MALLQCLRKAETSPHLSPGRYGEKVRFEFVAKGEMRAVIRYEWAVEYQEQKFITASWKSMGRCDVEANGAEMVSHIQ